MLQSLGEHCNIPGTFLNKKLAEFVALVDEIKLFYNEFCVDVPLFRRLTQVGFYKQYCDQIAEFNTKLETLRYFKMPK